MIRKRMLHLSMSLIAVSLSATEVLAGDVFDAYLNYPMMDVECRKDTGGRHQGDGLVLAVRNLCGMTELTPDRPLGQTFKIGPDADILYRISTGICHWPDEWTENESITFTLYDSPAKKKKLYSRTIPFAQKWHKWDIPFDVELPTKPGTEYYFEIVHNGGDDNKLRVCFYEENLYDGGQAYVAGQPQPNMDLYFVTLIKKKADREANLRKFLDRWDYSRPQLKEAGEAYQVGKLDEACQLVLEAVKKHLRENPDLWWKADPNFKKSDEWERIEKIVDEGKYWKKAEKGEGMDYIALDENTTWREVYPHTSGFIRHNDLFRKLGWAYELSGDEKFARKLNEVMYDYIEDNSSPFDGGMRSARSVAMFQAWRLNDAWSGFRAAMDSKGLSDDVMLSFLDYMDRSAYFAMTEPSGGNHANAVAEALMKFATNWPLYKGSKTYFTFGYEKLWKNSLRLFLDDGACKEPAYNYHGYSLLNLIAGMNTAVEYGMEIPQEIHDVIEKALAYRCYVLYPDGQAPTYGDTNIVDFRHREGKWQDCRSKQDVEFYEKYGRDDLIYIATDGKQGTQPEKTSVAFPDIGHYIMRSGWGQLGGEDYQQARYLFLRTGRIGSHGHEDMNEIMLYAYGSHLLLDPGRTSYGTPLMFELSRPWSHNVLLYEPDRIDQNPDEPIDDNRARRMNHQRGEVAAWATTPAMDYADCTYTELYPGINHRRAIVFVRPDYWVMFDQADAKERANVGINFWLTPPDPVVDEKAGTVMTQDTEGANLLMKVIRPSRVEMTQRHGRVDLDGQRDDIPVLTFWRSNAKKAEFVTLMYPFAPGQEVADVPAEMQRRGGGVVEIGPEDQRDYVYCGDNADSRSRRTRRSDVSFDGLAGLIRTEGGQVTSFGLVDGTQVAMGKTTLAQADAKVPALSVRYLDDAVEVTCEAAEKSLSVATMGKTKAMVNGREKSIDGEMFQPF